jgi:hypothetical protein
MDLVIQQIAQVIICVGAIIALVVSIFKDKR